MNVTFKKNGPYYKKKDNEISEQLIFYFHICTFRKNKESQMKIKLRMRMRNKFLKFKRKKKYLKFKKRNLKTVLKKFLCEGQVEYLKFQQSYGIL
jgi:hypothetical protein